MKMTNKEKLGFIEDRIIIFKGNTYPLKDWFKSTNARYHPIFGWYFSTVPDVYPNELVAEELYWEDITLADGDTLKPDHEIVSIVNGIRFDSSSSEFVGKIGETLILNLFVDKAKTIQSQFGECFFHVMHDKKGNEFIWTSSRKELAVGQTYTLRARVKDHKTYQGRKQTIINYCVEI